MSVYVQTNQTVLIPNGTPYAVLASDTGKIHLLPLQTAACAISLPAAAAGLRYRFIVTSPTTLTGVTTITPASGTMSGMLINRGVSAITLAFAVKSGAATTVFATGCIYGDWLEVICDGTNWNVSGMSQVVTGLV